MLRVVIFFVALVGASEVEATQCGCQISPEGIIDATSSGAWHDANCTNNPETQEYDCNSNRECRVRDIGNVSVAPSLSADDAIACREACITEIKMKIKAAVCPKLNGCSPAILVKVQGSSSFGSNAWEKINRDPQDCGSL